MRILTIYLFIGNFIFYSSSTTSTSNKKSIYKTILAVATTFSALFLVIIGINESIILVLV